MIVDSDRSFCTVINEYSWRFFLQSDWGPCLLCLCFISWFDQGESVELKMLSFCDLFLCRGSKLRNFWVWFRDYDLMDDEKTELVSARNNFLGAWRLVTDTRNFRGQALRLGLLSCSSWRKVYPLMKILSEFVQRISFASLIDMRLRQWGPNFFE